MFNSINEFEFEFESESSEENCPQKEERKKRERLAYVCSFGEWQIWLGQFKRSGCGSFQIKEIKLLVGKRKGSCLPACQEARENRGKRERERRIANGEERFLPPTHGVCLLNRNICFTKDNNVDNYYATDPVFISMLSPQTLRPFKSAPPTLSISLSLSLPHSLSRFEAF